ncbi:uncharacterized protein [Mytilus edulis]|uniref:uncharacterized protein n=1 Tax=Mytilus edulis TaxID=6550 RepID=UPI0039EDEB7B
MQHHVMLEFDFTEFLKTIWNKWKGDTSEVLGMVNKRNIFISDLMSLRTNGEVNDQIINIYCGLVAKKFDQVQQMVYCIDSFVITDILVGRNPVNWSQKDDIRQYDFVIGCINEGRCHWVAIVSILLLRSFLLLKGKTLLYFF